MMNEISMIFPYEIFHINNIIIKIINIHSIYRILKYIILSHTCPCGLMDMAPVYGTGDSRFESVQGLFVSSPAV